jgi:hypothetical protein
MSSMTPEDVSMFLASPDTVFDGVEVSFGTGCSISGVLSFCHDRRSVYFEHRHLCESPIECMAFAALLALLPTASVAEKPSLLCGDWCIGIIPQMQRFGYRLDFGVIVRASRRIFGLECDGRRYHTDRHHDCVRSSELWQKGIIVDRVTGSSLFRDAIEAVTPFARRVLHDDYMAELRR